MARSRIAYQRLILTVQKTTRDSYLDREVSIFIKIFKFYPVTQSLSRKASIFSRREKKPKSDLKVHKIENFFGSDYEFCNI